MCRRYTGPTGYGILKKEAIRKGARRHEERTCIAVGTGAVLSFWISNLGGV